MKKTILCLTGAFAFGLGMAEAEQPADSSEAGNPQPKTNPKTEIPATLPPFGVPPFGQQPGGAGWILVDENGQLGWRDPLSGRFTPIGRSEEHFGGRGQPINFPNDQYSESSDVDAEGVIFAILMVAIPSLIFIVIQSARRRDGLLWDFKTGLPVISSPAIGPSGIVYVGSTNQSIYALDGKTGINKWEFVSEDAVVSSPAVGTDGTVYVGSHSKVQALDGKTGLPKWEFETGNVVVSPPAIAADGTIYIGSSDK